MTHHLLVACSVAIVAIGLLQIAHGWRNVNVAIRSDRASWLVVAETTVLIGAGRVLIGALAAWHYPMYGPISHGIIPLTLAISLLEVRKWRRLRRLCSNTESGPQSQNLQV